MAKWIEDKAQKGGDQHPSLKAPTLPVSLFLGTEAEGPEDHISF